MIETLKGAASQGRAAVHRMVQAGYRAELVHVQAALNCGRLTSNLLCGRWVNERLPAEARPIFGRRNLRTLAGFGILVPTGETARSGHRAYYTMPDMEGVSRALRGHGFPG